MSLQQELIQKEAELAEIRRKIAEKPKRKKKGEYLVPYDPDGNLMSWAGNGFGGKWQENTPFRATMILDNKSSRTHDYGRSTKYWWQDDYGHLYPMFPISLYQAVMKGAAIYEGKISGLWQVTKKGDNYGIEWQRD